MTPHQINNLTVRELDAAVAEHLMGREDAANDLKIGWPLPRYSSDISSAFEVVEKMKESKCALELLSPCDHLNGFLSKHDLMHYWDSHFYTANKAFDSGTGNTAAEAICKAALIAHFTEKGEPK